MTTQIKTAGDSNPQAALKLIRQANLIAEAVKWQAFGARLIRDLTADICEVDKLFHEIQTIASSPIALRSFCRALQKHIERRGRL